MSYPREIFSNPTGLKSSLCSSPRLWEWGLIALLFLALRLGGLALFHPFFGNGCAIEEYYRGMMGHEILKGLSMPYLEYRADDSGGGSLVFGILAAVFFKVFGSSAFVLKSIPVLISLGALLLWFKILYQEVSRRCAWYFSLAFIFAPAVFQSWSLYALGDHYETMFLSALAVRIFLKCIRSNKEEKGVTGIKKQKERIGKRSLFCSFLLLVTSSYSLYFLLGVVCGFGVWFAYIFALTVVALLLLWLVKDRQFFKKPHFWIFEAGFLAGFSPWIWSNVHSGFGGLKVHNAYLWWHFRPGGSLEYWKMYYWKFSVLRDFFGIFFHPKLWPTQPQSFVNWLYAGFLVAPITTLVCLKLWHRIPGKKNFPPPLSHVSLYFTFYALAHSAAIQFTDFKAVRYMMPVMPAIFFAWARAIESLESFSPRLKNLSRIVLVVPFLGLGVFLWISMVSPAFAGYLLKTPGYAYDYTASIPACSAMIPFADDRRIDHCARLHKKMSAHISSQYQKGLWLSLAANMAEIAAYRNSVSIVDRLDFPDSEYAAAFYFHFGRFVFQYHSSDVNQAFSYLKSMFDANSAALKLSILGLLYAAAQLREIDTEQLTKETIPEEIKENYSWSLGFQHSRFWQKIGLPEEQILSRIDEVSAQSWSNSERAAFFSGMGSHLIQNTFDSPILGLKAFAKMKENLNPEDKKAFSQGVGRAYEIVFLFLPAPCETWDDSYFLAEKDPVVSGWIDEGRSEIRTITDQFKLEI